MDLETQLDSDQIKEQLKAWKRSYNVCKNIPYQFSPQWDDFEATQWCEYERLRRLQQDACSPPMRWQQSVAKYRSDMILIKERQYSPFHSGLLHLCPLSIYLDYHLGQNSQDRRYPFRATLSNWARFRELCEENSEFKESLSPSQLSSYVVLEDWWSSAYCNSVLVEAARGFLEDRMDVLDTSKFTEKFFRRRLSEAAMTEYSLYHASCLELFLKEFHPQLWEPYQSLRYLRVIQGDRFSTTRLASAQRLSYSFLWPGGPPYTAGTVLPAYPNVQMRRNKWIARPELDDRPYYLWDALLRETVVVEDLPNRYSLEYICISHTWGRWRIDPPAEILGVPWPVPRNTKFDVEQLPEHLSTLGGRYIWIDLFCIPQELSERTNIEIARQAAIFRNSSTCIAWLNDIESWGGLEASLAWLSLRFSSGTTRSHSSLGADSPLSTFEQEVADLAELPTKLMQYTPATEDEPEWEDPVGWFTSLWTLQEAVLCPNLQICTRDWTKLTDPWGVPIGLKPLMLFIAVSNRFCILEGPISKAFIDIGYIDSLDMRLAELDIDNMIMDTWPNGPRELRSFDIHTRLKKFLETESPTIVCSMASARRCTGSRAPAIMSALGVTEWYKQCAVSTGQFESQDLSAEPLLHGAYPADFIREAFSKFGAAFFEPMPGDISISVETCEAIEARTVLGSMMPFTRGEFGLSRIWGSYDHLRIDPCEHPSVKSWTIHADGTVRITRAGLVASSHSAPGFGPSSGIPRLHADLEVSSSPVTDTEDFVGTLQELAGERGRIYAVCLFEDCSRPYGVLLFGLGPQAEHETDYLVRIGNFGVPSQLLNTEIDGDARLVHDVHVDWNIL